MLPFLKKRESGNAGLIVKTREPDEKPESDEKDDSAAAIESCASALINAIHARDHKGVAMALKDAFDVLDSMPHEEGPHVEPHSYAAQNIKAGAE